MNWSKLPRVCEFSPLYGRRWFKPCIVLSRAGCFHSHEIFSRDVTSVFLLHRRLWDYSSLVGCNLPTRQEEGVASFKLPRSVYRVIPMMGEYLAANFWNIDAHFFMIIELTHSRVLETHCINGKGLANRINFSFHHFSFKSFLRNNREISLTFSASWFGSIDRSID